MHIENLNPPDLVRSIDEHLTVETAGTQQRRVEDFRSVGGGQQDQPAGGIETVHFHQQLVERLLLLVMPAGQWSGAAGAAEGVQFVDKDDRWRLGPRLFEEIAHPRGTDADEHLDELGTGNGEERHLRLASDGACQQRLAGAGRADQQHTLGHASA